MQEASLLPSSINSINHECVHYLVVMVVKYLKVSQIPQSGVSAILHNLSILLAHNQSSIFPIAVTIIVILPRSEAALDPFRICAPHSFYDRDVVSYAHEALPRVVLILP